MSPSEQKQQRDVLWVKQLELKLWNLEVQFFGSHFESH